MRIDHYLHRSAERHAGKTALVAGETRLSYGELKTMSEAFATALIARGANPGDRVVLVLDNGWRMAVAVFGCWMAGAVACPINPSSKVARLSQILDSCTPFAVVAEARLEKVVSDAAGSSPLLRIVCGAPNPTADGVDFDAMLEEPIGALPQNLPDTDLAVIIYTSGSTGEPKGVMLAHDNMHAAVRSITSYLDNRTEDILLGVLPLSFGYGLNQTAFQRFRRWHAGNREIVRLSASDFRAYPRRADHGLRAGTDHAVHHDADARSVAGAV